MARETPRGGPRQGARPRPGHAPRLHGDPRIGAGLEAPTAPHATSPVGRPRKLTGPARFWDRRRVRLVLALAFGFSMALHWFVAPWRLLPKDAGIEWNDPDAELSIPVDLMEEPAAPPPPEPAPPAPTQPDQVKDPNGPNAAKPDGSAPKPKIVDAGESDAEVLADGSSPASTFDGGAPRDAGEGDAGDLEAGLVALGDAGGGQGQPGPRDPAGMVGLKNVVNAGPQLVTVVVNNVVIRQHPIGKRISPVVQKIPQWADFMRGSQGAVDPIRDTDWILIYGPSLIHTDKDEVLVRYNIADSVVDATIENIAKAYEKGGAYDVGVPGVKASLGHADQADRVFIRPHSKLLVISPPSHAKEAARAYKGQMPSGPKGNEAVRLVMKDPAKQTRIPGVTMSGALTELRLWVVPRSDGGADVFAEGDCKDEASATQVADGFNQLIQSQNSMAVRFATQGLLNKAVVVAEGSKVSLHLEVSAAQLELLLQFVAGRLGATVPPPASPPSPQ